MVMIMGYCHIMKSLGYYPTLKVQNRYPSGSKHGWVGNSRTKIIALWTAGRFTEVHRKKMRNQHDFPGFPRAPTYLGDVSYNIHTRSKICKTRILDIVPQLLSFGHIYPTFQKKCPVPPPKQYQRAHCLSDCL